MHKDAATFYDEWPSRMNAMKAAPGGADIGRAFGPFFQGLMKDTTAEGGLSVKHKELIALGIGIASRCEPCIYAHVEKCLKAGATATSMTFVSDHGISCESAGMRRSMPPLRLARDLHARTAIA